MAAGGNAGAGSVNPFKIDCPTVISFSGGRSSALMLRMILNANNGLPPDAHVLFANTGKEMPETLDFVRDCGEQWGCPIVWLEYLDAHAAQQRWTVVDYASASRSGEPFSALIGRKQLLPNPVTRICTSELKIRPMKLYAQQVLGFDHWDVLIGFRADEPRRVAKLSTPNHEPFDRRAPLSSAGITKHDVSEFWARHHFDLQLPNNNGVTMHGNCDLCFLKGARQVLSLIREQPARAIWWAHQETRITQKGGNGHVFRVDRMSYSRMMQLATGGQSEMFAFDNVDDAEALDCACTD